jgi:hypothetical protein
MRRRVPDIVRWLVVAALAGMAWASAMETIELDGYRATFDPSRTSSSPRASSTAAPSAGPPAFP